MEAGGDVGPQEAARARKRPQVMQVEEDIVRNWLLEAPVSFAAIPLPSMDAVWQSLGGKPMAPAHRAASSRPRRLRLRRGAVGRGASRRSRRLVLRPGRRDEGRVIDTGVDCTHPDLKCDLGSGSLSDIVKGINWAAKKGVDVISMSLGGASGSAALQRAINAALAKGVVVVAAAGNSGPDPDTVGYPAGYPGVIAVAASDSEDGVAKFSSRGDAVAFIAPGVDILSTVPGGGYAKFSGTSMACPHMAGLAALAIERGAKGPSGVRAAFARAAAKLR